MKGVDLRLDRMPLRACLELAPIANQGLMNLALLFVAYLARQTRNKKLSQNHNSLILMTNPLQACPEYCAFYCAVLPGPGCEAFLKA